MALPFDVCGRHFIPSSYYLGSPLHADWLASNYQYLDLSAWGLSPKPWQGLCPSWKINTPSAPYPSSIRYKKPSSSLTLWKG